MSTNQNRDEQGRYAPENPQPEMAGQAPEEDYSWAVDFAKAAGITPDDDPYKFRRAADQWNSLSDERYGPAVYQQLKQQFEPEPEPEPFNWNQEPEQYMEPQNQYPPVAPQGPPAGITPGQLQQWWESEQQNVVEQAQNQARDTYIQQQLNEEVEEYGSQHNLTYEEKEFIFQQAYQQVYTENTTPRKAIQAKGDGLLKAQAERFAAANQANPAPGQPPAPQAPSTPPAGPPAASTQQYESLEELEEATRRGEFS